VKIEKFDVIVIGAGSGLTISSTASSMGLKVAIVEKGPMGGTCLNRGCIPSKILIHRADLMEDILRAGEFGLKVGKPKVNFAKIVKETSDLVDEDAKSIEKGIKSDKNTKLFKVTGRFVGKKIIQVGSKRITADKIFIVAGTRPSVPPVKGIEKVKYLTSKEALRLKKQPKSITFIGGGYITCELAHFYGALGSKVNIIQRNVKLIPREDEEVSKKFTKLFSKKYNVLLGYIVLSVEKKGKNIVLKVQKKNKKGPIKTILTEQLVVATGRGPNSDLLEVEKSGIKVNKYGYIKTNDFFRD